jgi:putative zinc finger/helix-turn-helix YgiT family protein
MKKQTIERARKCFDCGREMRGRRQKYLYTECGLNSVTLENVPVFECACGAKVPEIPSIQELHTLIAVALLQKSSLLSGDEVKFLRKSAGLSQSEVAKIIGVHATRPSKWESGESRIGKNNDRLLRAYCLFGMVQQVMGGAAGEETVGLLKAATFIRTLDVRKIFEQIKNTTAGSKPVRLTAKGSGDAADDGWTAPWLGSDASVGPRAIN